jgi:probable F420-dependent oxidoreductase
VKVRIGFGLGVRPPFRTSTDADPGQDFVDMVDALEANAFDSLWLSERVGSDVVDPVVGLAVAAGRTRHLKLGMSVMVLPGRNPALVAKEMATLDVLSGGRLLPAFGLGAAIPVEQSAFGVERGDRASMFDEALGLLRRFWTEDLVDHHGRWYRYEGVGVRPHPRQGHLDVWLGGQAPSELRRIGRLADGWLASFLVPDEADGKRADVVRAADAAGREIDPEHFGVLIPYVHGPIPESMVATLAARRPDLDPSVVVPSGWPALRGQIESFVEAGFSKFVVLPAGVVESWADELGALAAEVGRLQGVR